jgi:phosphoribosylformimino-5-aminoimidazole carboxamide ribonucleotide (ProFAR) isomerase
VGMDARPDRLREYPWHGPAPTFDALVEMLASEGVRRLVVSHWMADDLSRLGRLAAASQVEFQLAGGATDVDTVLTAHGAGAHALILGEALFTGAVDYSSTVIKLSEAGAQPAAHG